MDVVSFRLSQEQRDTLGRIADRRGCTPSVALREILDAAAHPALHPRMTEVGVVHLPEGAKTVLGQMAKQDGKLESEVLAEVVRYGRSLGAYWR